MATNGSLQFPFSEDIYKQSLKRTTTINETIATAIRVFVLTSPGQRRGNNIGSILPSFKHQLIPDSAIDGIASEIKQELVAQFPGVSFPSVNLTQEKEENVFSLYVTITFSTVHSELTELRVLV